MSGIKYWIWLSGLAGLKPKTKHLLLEYFSDPQAIYFANEVEYDRVDGITGEEKLALRDKELSRANEILGRCEQINAQVVTIGDSTYPERLRHIFDPPLVLYVLGKLPWLDEEVPIAIVGTRKATEYGISMGYRFGADIVNGGGIVVSGLASGVDSAGAKGALTAGGRCIGVLGTAIDVIYPRENTALFRDVMYHGALISEFPPGYPTQGANFPRRNRIISGLSVGVLVIEAPKKSGALITAARAAEQGRDVFVVPGNIDSPNCIGSNELIKDGAKAVMTGNDILIEYQNIYPQKIRLLTGKGNSNQSTCPEVKKEHVSEEKLKPAQPETGKGFFKLRVPNPLRQREKESQDLQSQLSSLTSEQLSIISSIGDEQTHVDDIAERTQLPIQKVLSELTVLQIKGYVNQEKGKRFSLNVKNVKRG